MNRHGINSTFGAGSLLLALAALASQPASPPNAEPDRNLVVVEGSVGRSVFQTTGATDAARLCVASTNRFADPTLGLLPGDTFLFRLPAGCGTFAGSCRVETDPIDTWSPLVDADFSCMLLPDLVQVIYVGYPKPFVYNDRFCVPVSYGSPTPTSCAMQFLFQPRSTALPPYQPSGVHRIANVAKPTFFTVDVVDPISGPVGPVGPVGPRGLVGDTGATGPMGPQGVVGPTGLQGVQGIAGTAGAVGATGSVGTTGAAGPRGLDGAVGATGAGTTGATGPAGRDGLAGPTGPTGNNGPSGPTGVGAVGPPGPAGGSDAPCRRFYYLTPGLFRGNQALTACDTGYHMATRFELPAFGSSFVYDTARGLQRPDSGYGPPAVDGNATVLVEGWTRTSQSAATAPTGGNPNDPLPNCNLWTSGRLDEYGILGFPGGGGAFGGLDTCATPHHVWCVQD
jgi:hypothetical protein